MHDYVMPAEPQDAMFGEAETTSIQERLVVAPRAGRFVPLPPENLTAREWVARGQAVGQIQSNGTITDVRSPFQGWVMGRLALPGQPVREGDARFWERST